VSTPRPLSKARGASHVDQVAYVDIEAERYLIGALLLQPHHLWEAVDQLDPDDMVDSLARMAYRTLADLGEAGEKISVITVYEHLRVHHALTDWLSSDSIYGTARAVAAHLARLTATRSVWIASNEARAALAEGDDPWSVAAHLEKALVDFRTASVPTGAAMLTGSEVANRDTEEMGWLIPGLMYRQDTVILVAGEGAGKTLLGRQVALCAEAGLHPMTRFSIPPVRTLTIDLENKPRAVTADYRKVLRAIHTWPTYEEWHSECKIWEQPNGIDLLSARGQRTFSEALRAEQPDLVVVGPLYKMFRAPKGAEKDAERDAAEVSQFLDDCRVQYKCGFWIEAHAPHGADAKSRDLRPYGPSLWQRWPELGRSFRRVKPNDAELTVGSFRGDRGTYYWPETLVTAHGKWPFTGRYGQRTDLNIYGFPQ
jgi:replicative DNA helicase